MRFSQALFAGLSLGLTNVARADVEWDKSDRSEIAYVTRPDLRPQRLNVTTFKPDLVTPGYFFISPFSRGSEVGSTHAFIPAQIGPHIYDESGDLIWSAAHRFGQRNGYSLETTTLNGEQVLSFLVRKAKDDAEEVSQHRCAGIIMNNHYEVVDEILGNDGGHKTNWNMHEFNVVDDGKHALAIIVYPGSQKKDDGSEHTFSNDGFQEVDIASGETVFTWKGADYIPVREDRGDPFHINALDKTPDGNYLVSARHMSTIYLVSGKDGSVIWRVGRDKSSFKHVDDFTFDYQHHVRFVERNETHTLISFLDNNAWEPDKYPKGKQSSATLLSLSTAEEPMTATVVKRWYRPDLVNAYRRGSVQILPNGQAIVAWGELGYMSEFTWDGELVQEVRFQETRFDDYRAYKLNFTGYSNEPIAVVSQAVGGSASSILTSIYVSWNGATEVKGWKFYGKAEGKSKSTLLGYQDKTGFETVFMAKGFYNEVYAEAIGKDDKVMDKSDTQTTTYSTLQQPQLESWIAESVNLPDTQDANCPTPGDSTTEADEIDDGSTLSAIKKKITPSLSGAAGLVLGLILGIAGSCVTLCMVRRRQSKRNVGWTGVPLDEAAQELEDELALSRDDDSQESGSLLTKRREH